MTNTSSLSDLTVSYCVARAALSFHMLKGTIILQCGNTPGLCLRLDNYYDQSCSLHGRITKLRAFVKGGAAFVSSIQAMLF